jgi:hypothetical protein
MNIAFGSSYAALRFAGNQAQKPAEKPAGQKEQAAQQQPAQPPQQQAVNG